MAKKLTRLRIDEVSSVDRGAGEGVKIMLMKRNAQHEEKPMSKISTMFSKLFGGVDNSAIIDKSVEGLAESVTSILGADDISVEERSAALGKSFEQFGEHLKETLTAGPAVAKKGESEMDITVLRKALGLADTATEADIAKMIADSAAAVKKLQSDLKFAKAEFTPEELAHYEKAFPPGDDDEDDKDDGKKKKKAFRLASHQERASLMKAAEPPLPAHIQKIMDDNAAMAKRLAELEGGKQLVEMTKRAVELGLPEAEGVTLQKAYAGDKAAIDKLVEHQKSLIAQAKAGKVFKEFGTSGGTGVPTDAVGELDTLAKALQKTEPKLSYAQAFAKVYEANPELAAKERNENRPAA